MRNNTVSISLTLQSYFLSILFVSFSSLSFAASKDVIDRDFWGMLYKNGGETFYCNKPFKKKGPLISESYIYSSTWIREYLDCGTKRQCKKNNPDYNKIISDLHNIVPSDAYFEFKRKNSMYGTLDKTVEPNECGIRKKHHILEPADHLKGDIARILMYMHTRYHLPLNTSLSLLKFWNDNDMPDSKEKKRNKAIKAIQGNGNPYIEDTLLIDTIKR